MCVWDGGVWVKTKIRQEMRKENEKEISAKIVMRHYNHRGWDETGKLEQRRIEKSRR